MDIAKTHLLKGLRGLVVSGTCTQPSAFFTGLLHYLWFTLPTKIVLFCLNICLIRELVCAR